MRTSEAQSAGWSSAGWPLELAMRIVAGGLVVVGLAICHSVALSEGMTFFVLPVICASVVLLTKAQGGPAGCGVGIVVGMSLSIGLTAQSAAFGRVAAINQLAFAMIAITITGLLGYVGGCWRGSMFASGTGVAPVTPACGAGVPSKCGTGVPPKCGTGVPFKCGTGVPPVIRHVAGCNTAGCVTVDFGNWLDDENTTWASFDQFVRTTLRGRLAAAHVRCFHVDADLNLEPLTQNAAGRAGSDRDGNGSVAIDTIPLPLLERVVVEREIYIAPRKVGGTGGRIASRDVGRVAGDRVTVARSGPRPRAAGGRHAADDATEQWSWLLPIHGRGRVCGVVAIGHFMATWPTATWPTASRAGPRNAADVANPDLAAALALVLSVAWRHVASLHALQHGLQRDGQSGVLNRSGLLERMDQTVAESVRDGEPVMMMGIVIEGLRGLDDSGDFAGRDDLIARLGDALRDKVRTDDVVGRFADDRFVVVLRRLETRLGSLIAEKLIQTLKLELSRRGRNDSCDSDAAQRLFIRASLASADPSCADGTSLLSRALALLDNARVDGVELAIDPTLSPRADAVPAGMHPVAARSQENA